MNQKQVREKQQRGLYDRACALLANTEYTIDATVQTQSLDQIVIVPHCITTSGMNEIEKEFPSHLYSSSFGGFVVDDF
jgi:hypothetical protein